MPRAGDVLPPGRVVVAGVAWAPTRGIRAVEAAAEEASRGGGAAFERMIAAYGRWLDWVLDRQAATLAVAVLTLALPAGLPHARVSGRYFLARCGAHSAAARDDQWEIYLRRPLFSVTRTPLRDLPTGERSAQHDRGPVAAPPRACLSAAVWRVSGLAPPSTGTIRPVGPPACRRSAPSATPSSTPACRRRSWAMPTHWSRASMLRQESFLRPSEWMPGQKTRVIGVGQTMLK